MPAEAVLKALRHVWLTLESLGVPAALMGGLALAAWKHIRATIDIDLLASIGGHDIQKILQKLRPLEIHRKADRPITSVGRLDVIGLLYEPPETSVQIQIDLLTAKSGYHAKALERRIPMQLPDLDVGIAVLTCEDLILHKLLAGRIIDRPDAAALLRVNRATLDIGYLLRWVAYQANRALQRKRNQRAEHQDGPVLFQGKRFASLSAAATFARSTVIKRQINTHGWVFWRYRDEDGKLVPLDVARQEFLEREARPGAKR